MGIVGLVWVFDCFFGFYLTLPARLKEHARTSANKRVNVTKTFWQRWKISWRIRRTGSRYRFNFDLHRAGGLWFWFLLLVMAVSSVSFNLHEEVFEPVVDIFSPLTPSPFDVREERSPEQPIEARVSFREILTRRSVKRNHLAGRIRQTVFSTILFMECLVLVLGQTMPLDSETAGSISMD